MNLPKQKSRKRQQTIRKQSASSDESTVCVEADQAGRECVNSAWCLISTAETIMGTETTNDVSLNVSFKTHEAS